MNPWDERYNKAEYHYGTEPNDFLRAHAESLLTGKGNRVLCLADGEGRNSVYLASLGAQAIAVDISQVGLAKAQKLAALKGVQIETLHADLSQHEFGPDTYGGIAMIFCHLPPAMRPHLYAQIRTALQPGGWLLVECYNEQQLGRGTGGPPTAELMVSLHELEQAFSGFQVLHAENTVRSIVEGSGHNGEGAVCQFIARKL